MSPNACFQVVPRGTEHRRQHPFLCLAFQSLRVASLRYDCDNGTVWNSHLRGSKQLFIMETSPDGLVHNFRRCNRPKLPDKRRVWITPLYWSSVWRGDAGSIPRDEQESVQKPLIPISTKAVDPKDFSIRTGTDCSQVVRWHCAASLLSVESNNHLRSASTVACLTVTAHTERVHPGTCQDIRQLWSVGACFCPLGCHACYQSTFLDVND